MAVAWAYAPSSIRMTIRKGAISVLKGLLPETKTTDPYSPTPAQAAEYAGVYHSEEIEPAFRIEVAEERLLLRRLKAAAVTREPESGWSSSTTQAISLAVRDKEMRSRGSK